MIQLTREPLGLEIDFSFVEQPPSNSPHMGENRVASPPLGGIEGGLPLDEATTVAAAEALLDPTLLLLATLTGEQARLAETLAQAAEIVSEARPIRFGKPYRSSPSPAVTVSHSAAASIRALLEREPLFLDYETTGLHLKHGARVCEISLLNAQGRAIFSTVVNPQQPIPPAATQVHGLDDAAVAAAPTWGEIEATLRRLLEGRVVVAFSDSFERKFTPKGWAIEWVCAKKLADRALGRWPGRGNLQSRLAQCGLSGGQAHTAAGDNLSTLKLLRFLAGLEQLNN